MKAIRFLAITFISAMAFVGCSEDDHGIDPGTGGNSNTGDIVFNINIENPNAAGGMTRTATAADFKTTFVDGDEIGLFAVSYANGVIATLAATGNAIHNVKLTYSTADGGKWTHEALYYSGEQMDFYVYYPYNVAATNPTNITFNVLADQSDEVNYNASYRLSASAMNIAKSNTPVALTFKHQLALVQMEVDPGTIKGSGPTEHLVLTLRGCKAGGAFNLSTDSLTTGGDAVAVKMLRVEKLGDANYTSKYTYRALVPAQDVAQGTSLFLMAQSEQLYNTPSLTAALTLEQSKAKLYSAKLPATAIQTAKIPAGTFFMGSSDGSGNNEMNPSPAEPNRSTNEIQHKVTLTKDFYMSKYQVTNTQYVAFLNAKSVANDGKLNGVELVQDCSLGGRNPWGVKWDTDKWIVVDATHANHPVIYVTWHGAVAYCAWLSEQTGGTWRLPTEAQWEYACRGDYANKDTETATLPFGIGDGRKLVSGMANYYVQYSYDLDHIPPGQYDVGNNTGYLGQTNSVGSYTPNNYGLYDMHGNVWEWCSDWYGSYGSGAVTDPTGLATGSDRVLRGGSWCDDARNCRSAFRDNYFPGNASSNIGFRVVFVP